MLASQLMPRVNVSFHSLTFYRHVYSDALPLLDLLSRSSYLLLCCPRSSTSALFAAAPPPRRAFFATSPESSPESSPVRDSALAQDVNRDTKMASEVT